MANLLTFREAGQKLGVDRSVLKKLLRDGKLPQAEKIRRSQGWVWVLPDTAIEMLSQHPDLVIDVTQDVATAMIVQDKEPEVTTADSERVEPPQPGEENRQPQTDESIRHLSLAANNPTQAAPPAAPVGDVFEVELLDRMLAIQEAKTEAACRAEQAEYALEAAKTHYGNLETELNVERQERSMTSEKLRDEKLARKVADVKIAELNEQLVRETSIAEAERQERIASTTRTLDAEQKASYALASMNWFSRRKFNKTIKNSHR